MDRKSPRMQCSSGNVLAGPMGCPQAKVTNQRQGRACIAPLCAQSLAKRSLWEVRLQWEMVEDPEGQHLGPSAN